MAQNRQRRLKARNIRELYFNIQYFQRVRVVSSLKVGFYIESFNLDGATHEGDRASCSPRLQALRVF